MNRAAIESAVHQEWRQQGPGQGKPARRQGQAAGGQWPRVPAHLRDAAAGLAVGQHHIVPLLVALAAALDVALQDLQHHLCSGGGSGACGGRGRACRRRRKAHTGPQARLPQCRRAAGMNCRQTQAQGAAASTCSMSASTSAKEASPNTAVMMANSWLGKPAWPGGRSCLQESRRAGKHAPPTPALPKEELLCPMGRRHSPGTTLGQDPTRVQRILPATRHRQSSTAMKSTPCCQPLHSSAGRRRLTPAPPPAPRTDCTKPRMKAGRGGGVAGIPACDTPPTTLAGRKRVAQDAAGKSWVLPEPGTGWSMGPLYELQLPFKQAGFEPLAVRAGSGGPRAAPTC